MMGDDVVPPVQIASHEIGPGRPCFLVAEIGINHNGDLDAALALIDAAVDAGCDAVKFQKRTVDVVYSPEELARPRMSPFGNTAGDLKRGLEFEGEQYRRIDAHCRDVGIIWFASCWDEASVDFVADFEPPCYKVSSASLTDTRLLERHRETGRPLLVSTGMSSLEEIDRAVAALGSGDLILLHTTSTYPAALSELNLRVMLTLGDRYGVPVGYSGHEVGLAPTLAARALGACVVERHLTLDRATWGSDHAASIEPHGFKRLARDIRAIETSMGDGTKRVYASEVAVRTKLRRVGRSDHAQ